MALQPAVNPYIRSILVFRQGTRPFAAAAAAKPKYESAETPRPKYELIPAEPLKTTTVGNITVSSIETNQALTRLAVYFRAGSRHEAEGATGVSHALRIFSGLGTNGSSSQFGITRNIQHKGGNLYCTSGREHVGYVLEATRNNIKGLEDFLVDASSKQAFKRWELGDHLHRLKLDRILRPPEVRTLELLHKAAFRNSLGNSVYSPKYMVGKHNSKMLQNFVAENFGTASIVAIGLPHDQVVQFAGKFKLPSKAAEIMPQKYHGGEIRKESGGEFAYVALAVEGKGTDSPKEMIACALLHRALGSGPRVKYGNIKGALQVATRTPKESVASGFSVSYTDSGLVGAFLTASPCCIEMATKKAAEILRNPTISEDDLKRAKSGLKTDMNLALETGESYLEDVALQSLHYKKVTPVDEIAKVIDSVTLADLKKITTGKLSIASYGPISKVPYLDQLK